MSVCLFPIVYCMKSQGNLLDGGPSQRPLLIKNDSSLMQVRVRLATRWQCASICNTIIEEVRAHYNCPKILVYQSSWGSRKYCTRAGGGSVSDIINEGFPLLDNSWMQDVFSLHLLCYGLHFMMSLPGPLPSAIFSATPGCNSQSNVLWRARVRGHGFP